MFELISITGLSLGMHLFEQALGLDFLKNQDYQEAEAAQLQVKIQLDKKTETQLSLFLHLEAKLIFPCDLCLEPLEISIKNQEKILVLLKEEAEDIDEIPIDIWELPLSKKQLDLNPWIYQVFMGAIPLQKRHEKPCKDNEFNEDSFSERTDLRWEKLKKLL